MSFLEMVPVLLALWLWGMDLANKKVVLHIDNAALVAILNKQSCRSERLMQLVRKFVLLAMRHNVIFKAFFIPSVANEIADFCS